MPETHYRTCPLCEATCGLELRVEGDRITRVSGDRSDVFSAGFICPKGSALGRLHHDPDRLTSPRIKRSDQWVDVSWEEAFHEISERLDEVRKVHGPNAVGVYVGNPNTHNLAGLLYLRPFIKALGTRNVFSASTVDQMPKHVSSGLMFGHAASIPVPDIDRTDYLLMLGANPWASNGSLATAPDWPGRIKALQKRGGRLVVVDPRRSRTAQEADEHLFIRPGSDAAWLASIAHVILSEGLTQTGVLEAITNGTDELAHLLDPFSPEAVESTTHIAPEVTRRIAAELSAAPTAAVYGRMGTHTASFGTVASWLADVLNLITGNLDRPGGAMFPRSATERPRKRPFKPGRWTSRVGARPEMIGEIPVAGLADEILTEGPEQVRAMFTVAGNPVLSTPDASRLDDALGTLDFMVSVDPYLNETTRHADVILPPPSALTASHFDLAFLGLAVRNVVNYSPPVFDLEDDASAEWEILVRLALIAAGVGPVDDISPYDDMGVIDQIGREIADPNSRIYGRDAEEILGMLSPRIGPERLIDFLVRVGPYGDGFGSTEGLTLEGLIKNPHGIDLGPLEPRLPDLLSTASNKIEAAPEWITADLPRLADSLAASSREGLRLVGRRHLRSNNSWMHNVEVLVKGKERCTLQVHPEDAARIGLRNEGDARVSAGVGSLVAPVEITEGIMPGVVSLPHGWGHDLAGTELNVASARPGVNSNVLAPADVDPISGNAVLNGIAVEVAPA